MCALAAAGIYLWRTGTLASLVQQLRRGPRSAAVRYVSLTGDSDWLDGDDDDTNSDDDTYFGSGGTGGLALEVTDGTGTGAEGGNSSAATGSADAEPAPAAPSVVAIGGEGDTAREVHQGTSGAWEIRWDEDLEDDGGIGAWGALPVPQQADPNPPSESLI